MCQRREYIPPFEWPPAIAGMVAPFIILILLSACAGRNPLTIERPNARTDAEERAYNTLLVSERMITEAEASNAAGTLPEFMRPVVNALIDVHNTVKESVDVYLAALGSGAEATETADLLRELDELDAQITKMFNRGGDQ